MRPEENPLDLNNFPDENARDGKQVLEDSSFSGWCSTKKKSGKKDAKEECEKVYECRFCSLKFCKSQALGGHMNRHRQERETETLNQARQLVFRNDRTTQVAPHLGCCQPIAASSVGSYHPASNMGDPTIRLKFPRYISGSSSTHMSPQVPPPPQQPSQPFLSRPISFPPSHHHSSQSQHPVMNDYYVGHVLPGNHPHKFNYAAAAESNYTCIGAPVGAAFGKDRSLHNQEEGMNWGRSYSGAQQRLDPPSVINLFQDGF